MRGLKNRIKKLEGRKGPEIAICVRTKDGLKSNGEPVTVEFMEAMRQRGTNVICVREDGFGRFTNARA